VTRSVIRHSERMKKRYGDFLGKQGLLGIPLTPCNEDFVQETSEVDQD
jgi:hypothetical protein